jgi:hypothetical protein
MKNYRDKYAKYKYKYLSIIGGNNICQPLFKIIEKYNYVLKKDILIQYNNLLKQNILVCDNGRIQFKYDDNDTSDIVWKKLKKNFENNLISVDVMKGIGGLRKMTVQYLLHEGGTKINTKIYDECYVELGSTNPTSDLDFTYISFNEPSKVLDLMIIFYNEFNKIFGNYPDVTFDTNFYICNTFIKSECFKTITNNNIKQLFVDDGNFKRLYNFKNKTYEKIDRYICFKILDKFIEDLKVSDNDHNKMTKLIKSSRLFYDMFQYINKIKINNNELLLIIRGLYYIMSASSNESYISDTTYKIIVLNKKMEDIFDYYLSYLDNFAFIEEWYLLYKENGSIIGFFDMACKYIVRCGKSLENTEYYNDITKELLQDSNYWRNNIRGQISLTLLSDVNVPNINMNEQISARTKIKIIEGKNIINKLNHKKIKDIYDVFYKIYLKIKLNFVQSNSVKSDSDNTTDKVLNLLDELMNNVSVIVTDSNISVTKYDFNNVISKITI